MPDDETADQKAARQRIHDAVQAELHHWDWSDDLLVEWIMVVATTALDGDGTTSVGGVSSERLPWHHALGLLTIGIESGWAFNDDE